MDIDPQSDTCFANIFSKSVACLILNGVFHRAEVLSFNEVQHEFSFHESWGFIYKGALMAGKQALKRSLDSRKRLKNLGGDIMSWPSSILR